MEFRARMWTSVCLSASPQVQMRPEWGQRWQGALVGVGSAGHLLLSLGQAGAPGRRDGRCVQDSW